MCRVDPEHLEQYFKKSALIPAIAYEVDTKTVLMLAYMNEESLRKTLETGYTWYWSRSRQELWNKGATSGHVQEVVSIYSDCDNDTLLLNVRQTGAACHTGSYSCFFHEMYTCEKKDGEDSHMNALQELYEVVLRRKALYDSGQVDIAAQKSYTCYLFDKGEDKILKKCGEECAETIIAAKNHDNDELKNEMADLLYHLMVLCVQQGLSWAEVEEVLAERSQKIGNLKTFKNVNHDS